MKKEIFTYGFEKLNVWQQSVDFVKKIYICVDSFPKNELYGLTSQIKRAVTSIPANIAEGTTRKSFKDQARFTEIT